MAVFDLDAYAKELEAAGVAKSLIDKLQTDVRPGFLRQDDYSRSKQQLDAAAAQLREQHTKLSEYERYVVGLEQELGPREQWSAALRQRVEQRNPQDAGLGLSEADVQRRIDAANAKLVDDLSARFAEQLKATEIGAAVFSEFYVDANDYWRTKYGTSLPKDDFKKFFTENGHTNPNVALKLFEMPFADTKREEDFKRQLEQARIDGAQSVRSQLGVPETSAGSWADGAMSIGNARFDPTVKVTADETARKEAEFFAAFQRRSADPLANTATSVGAAATSAAK